MDDTERAIANNPDLQEALRQSGVDLEQGTKEDKKPIYKKIGSTRIPTSRHVGKMWKARRENALQKRRENNVERAWDEAIKYYNNDQLNHRDENDGDRPGNKRVTSKIGERFGETENIVYANANALVSILYSKNPSCEITPIDDADAPLATLCERLVTTLMNMRAAPGVNIKGKAKRALLLSLLTNRGYLVFDYITKEFSTEEALKEIAALSDQYRDAKTPQEVEAIEGKLMALEEKIDLLSPGGPMCFTKRPHDIIVDPDSENDDLTDAKWVMISGMLSVDYVNAVYGVEKDDETRSVYEPTHVLKTGKGGSGKSLDDEINTFSLGTSEKTHTSYGYDDEDTFRRCQRVKVWYVWDKVTRRVLMFNEKDWSFPMWVWDDPLKLDTFFPVACLSMYVGTEGGEAKGEVTYYLDQQDAINEINSEEARVRRWARKNIIYNSRLVTQDEAKQFLRGDDDTMVGINLPDGVKVEDVFKNITPPSIQFEQLFNVDRKLAAIDRISSVKSVQRGAEFKTNTTNKAIEEYTANQNTRLDEKLDAIEDFFAQCAWIILQMCLMNMDAAMVASILGESKVEGWTNMQPEEIRQKLQMRIVGGSTQKPTSAAKKQEAMQMGQILGQFARTSPAAILVALKVMQRAFDGNVVSEEDWTVIQQQLSQAVNAGGGGGGGGGADGDLSSNPEVQALISQIDAMPQEAKKALGDAMAKGVPVIEAVTRILERLRSSGGGSGADTGVDGPPNPAMSGKE